MYCGYSSSPSAKLSSTALCVVAEHAVAEPRDGLDDHERGELAAGEHDVADAQLAVAAVVEHALVDALVAPAQQREAVEARRARGDGLVEPAPPGVRASSGRQAPSVASTDSTASKIGPGREHHAGAAAEGRVVDGAPRVARVRAQVADAQVHARPTPVARPRIDSRRVAGR